jgi:hypothetical protein
MSRRLSQFRNQLIALFRILNHHIFSRPHKYLAHKSKLYQKWLGFRFNKHVRVTIGAAFSLLTILLVASFIQHALAFSVWAQSDWSGGVGTSSTNQYSSQTNLTTSTANQVTLPNTLAFSGNEITDATRTTNTQGDGVTPPDSSTGIWEGTTNLIRNGGFESGTSDWLTSNGSGSVSSISQISSTSKFGSKALQYAFTAGTGSWALLENNYHSYASTPNFNTANQYTLSFWAKLVSGNSSFRVEICDGSSTNFVMNIQTSTLTSSWARYTYTFTPLSAGVAPQIILMPSSFTTPVTFDVDGVQVEQKAYPTPYVDTNGATASRGAAQVEAPAADSNMTQGWYATRLRMDAASTSSVDSYLGQPYINSNSRLALHASGANWIIANDNASTVDSSASISSSYSAGTMETAVFAWTASTLSVSVNGGVFTTVSRASVPSGTLTQLDIGSSNGSRQADGDIKWAASGTGTLTNADAATLNTLGNTVPTFTNLNALNSGNASPAMSWAGSTTTTATTGTLTSAIFNSSVPENWGTLSYTATIPSGAGISVKVRGGNQPNLSDALAWSSCSPISSGSNATSSCLPVKTQYAQYQVTFTGSSTATPTLTNVSLNYSASDTTPPPVNASSLALHRSNGGVSVASDGWTNGSPYFTWAAGQDDSGGSGILGYCLYLGQDPTGDPITTKGDLGTSPVNTNGACQFAVSSTNLDTSIAGILGTALTTSNSPYYLNIKAIDNADNVYNGSSAQFEFNYDIAPPTNPAFITAPSEFVSSDVVTLTWLTTGSDAASDANSGVAGLQYRIGSGGTWYGANHNGNQDMTDLLTNNGSYTTTGVDLTNLQQGNNIVYFRTWDNAGNISGAYVTTVIKINSTAPSSPQNLTATPTTNTTNSFAFSWLAPATYTGSASNITYCYSVNTLPTSSNCTYTSPGQTSLAAGAYATEPGDNTFYLVAKDEAGNINYATAASVTFTANTPAPGIPLNPDIADISIKSTSTWKLALSWNVPSTVGAGIANYRIFRSTDGTNFTNIASTAGTSYVDSNLYQETYYYKVQACDSANNCGGFTDVLSMYPTGKFTSPANLLGGPTVSFSTRTATINWITDRASNSQVEYGLASGQYSATEASSSDQVVAHSLTLSNLRAGTTYYYRAQWDDIDGNIGTSREQSFTTLPAPTISNVTTSGINLSSATIQFTSSNATSVQLEYGINGLDKTQTLNTSMSTSTYSIPLSGLSPGTTYNFKLDPYDTSGNIYDSPASYSFTTPPQPTITKVEFEPIPGALTGTEQLSWTTNVPATSQISYGLLNGSRENQLDTTLTTSHSMDISNLNYDTQYSVTATSVDGLGNVANSDLQVFKSGVDTRPPIISAVTIQPSIVGTGADSKGQLIVSWKTDKAGTSQVTYGQGTSGNYSTTTAENTALVNNHVVVVSGLSTSEVYHLQVVSDDADRIKGVSTDQTTIIGQASDDALSIVFNSLRSIFGL